MSNRRMAGLAAFAATAALAGAAHAGGNLVSDGDFGTPYGGGSFSTYFASPSDGQLGPVFGPWTVTSGSIDLIGGYWQSPTGTGSVDIDGDSPGAISQSLSLGAGTYVLTFDMSGNPDGGPTTKTLDVSVGGASKVFTYTLGASNSESNMLYTPESLVFTATGPTTLTFASGDTGSPFGAAIGDVSVVAVPEPAAWALMLIGFAGLGGALRRRRGLALA